MRFIKVLGTLLAVTAILLGFGVAPSNAAAAPVENQVESQIASASEIEIALDAHIKKLEAGNIEIGSVQPPHNLPNIATPAWKLSGYEIDVTSVQNGTVMPTILASCGVGGKGGKCS